MHEAATIVKYVAETSLYVMTYMRPNGNLNTYKTGLKQFCSTTVIPFIRMR